MMTIPEIPVGITLTIQKKITDEETVANYGNGQVDNLLSTPALVALMQEASSQLLDAKLPDGFITVTQMVQVIHEKPSKIGSTVTVKVEVTAFDGNKVQLAMHAFDDFGPIGLGNHVRAVVNKESLVKRLTDREMLNE